MRAEEVISGPKGRGRRGRDGEGSLQMETRGLGVDGYSGENWGARTEGLVWFISWDDLLPLVCGLDAGGGFIEDRVKIYRISSIDYRL
jgi:hypothetical protein